MNFDGLVRMGATCSDCTVELYSFVRALGRASGACDHTLFNVTHRLTREQVSERNNG